MALPLAWQSNLQVDSAAHKANSEGLKNSSEHSQPSPYSHEPDLRPMALQVPSQNDSPSVHLEGNSSLKALKSMSFSLHLKNQRNTKSKNCFSRFFVNIYQHSLSSSQVPLDCPKTTQLAEQAKSPMVHRNPACVTATIPDKISNNFMIFSL